MSDIGFHVCLVKMRNGFGRTANVRHESTTGGGIVEIRKIVALQVLRSANRHVPERAKPIYYRARVIAVVLFAAKRTAAHNTVRGRVHNENIAH